MSDGKISQALADDQSALEEGGGSESGSTSSPSQGGDAQIRDRPSLLMYLPSELMRDLEVTTAELNAESREKRGRGLKKNAELYPVLLQVALDNLEEVREKLGLSE